MDEALRLQLARQGLQAGRIDPEDFDDARAGWSAEQVWQRMMDLLPLSPDAVLTHVDHSLDNIRLDRQLRVSGLIDWGRAGIADRNQDLAILANCLDECF